MGRTCSAHVLIMFCACSFHGNSMNNLLSYCGLVDAKIRASDKDLPVEGLNFALLFYNRTTGLCDRRKLNGLDFRFLAILVIFSTINNARAQNIEDDDLYEVSISLKMAWMAQKTKI